jgi:KTSC domain
MVRQHVSSSNLNSVGYNPSQTILEIEFNNGAVYQYFDVPQNVYASLMGASSHGKYFHANIQNNYRCTRVS